MRAVFFIWVLLAFVQGAAAQAPKWDTGISIEQMLAVGIDTGDLSQARLTLFPEVRVRWHKHWSAELDLRIEAAGSDTGLGTINTYDDISKPLELGPNTRLEIDKAALVWRKGSSRFTLGKQTLAWGVLDGLQVTDRFDAVRRREGVFTPQRPERISRWGVRLEGRWAGFRWDAATLLDGTADQFAEPGDVFEVRAPRLRAGLPSSAPLPSLRTSLSNSPTAGLRAHRSLGAADISLMVMRGPDTLPVIGNKNGQLTLEYPSRSLFGLTWQRGSGARVWRIEAAYIPDQSLNLATPSPSIGTRKRLLAGVGLDWDLPGSLFLNLQLGVDSLDGDGTVRPDTDTIATIRLQKSLSNDTLRASAEFLGNLADGDGTFRPAVAWQFNDQLRFETGVDVIWGDVDGLIGQFNGADRVWLRATWSI